MFGSGAGHQSVALLCWRPHGRFQFRIVIGARRRNLSDLASIRNMNCVTTSALHVVEQRQLRDGRIRLLGGLQGELLGAQLGGRCGVVHILNRADIESVRVVWLASARWTVAAVMALMRAPTEA